MKRRIMATSGGFLPTDRWTSVVPGETVLKMLELTGKQRPRICFVHTASGDDPAYLTRSYAAMSELGCDVTHLQLFTQPNAPVREHILKSDVIWVGGGSVANLLAVWQLHGVDIAMREAYEAGKILGGVSAGSICWHLGGPTDSFGPKLEPVTNALGLLPFGNGVHYDSEAQRRPLVHELVKTNIFDRVYATDDRVGILYEDEVAVEVITDRLNLDPVTSPAAYLIEKTAGEVTEVRLAPGLII
jgi:peptidase E